MNTSEINPQTFALHMALILDLPPEWASQPGVIANIARLLEIARSIAQFPLSDDIEVAPIFRP
ncbi:DUF4089 domain-containing protein [Roseofilum casamattae]|uniref:DUF4089 domain-containing protein n=1 Tax=Roseofilum casamattae BLCC-M143 TaxID=3022442 RepID=A0ABT7C1I1_9CYAN|nr:DUF4089 domain-containing protein [Roseofilum casamattae]MDJ1185313.1 DUF4089 domain-containing protein [Roseofilum casamattae BLCC-M143]